MGLCGSSPAAGSKGAHAVLVNMATFKRLGMTAAEANRLFQVFSKIDDDGSGEISLMEFFEYLDLDRTAFTKRAFSLFDDDKSGEISFPEFAGAVWNYCTFEKQSLVRFAFEIYDLDSSGAIDIDEVSVLVREVYGRGFETNMYARRLLEKMKTQMATVGLSYDIAISKEEFVAFAMKHPALLFPAFTLQKTLQTRIMGESFWDKATASRSKLFPVGDGYKELLKELTDVEFRALLDGDQSQPYSTPTPNNHRGNDFVRARLPGGKRVSPAKPAVPGAPRPRQAYQPQGASFGSASRKYASPSGASSSARLSKRSTPKPRKHRK